MRYRLFAVLGLIGILAGACGGSTPTTSTPPSSPTPSASASPSPSNPGGGTTSSPPSGGSTPTSPPSGGGALVTVAGFVPGAIPLSGSCPAIRFGVESKATGAYIDTVINANSATQYSGGTCSDVLLGTFLEVQGQQQADKSLVAVVVKFTPKGAPVVAPK